MDKKRSFWEKLTGSISPEEEYEEPKKAQFGVKSSQKDKKEDWVEEENEEAELAVDVYETPTDIVVETMVAGVRPEDLELSISRDMITINGKREEHRNIDEENYFTKELYWGRFTRTISLPKEIEPEEAEATERHGLLTLKLTKVDKEKTNNIKVRSI